MATRDEVLQAIDEAERRLEGVAEGARQRPDTPLLEGEWTVRDTLCHLAARANDVPNVLRFADPARKASGGPSETGNVNAKQIADRAGRSVDDLLTEARQGFAEARQAVRNLAQADLDRQVDPMGRGPMPVSELVRMSYTRHASGHIETIERALAGGGHH